MLSPRTAGNDSVIIHPPGFYIVGFETLPFVHLYFIFLVFVYAATVLFNVFVICIIAFNHCLHTPKFLAVANLAVIDMILNSFTIPSMVRIFLVKDNFVPFNLCLVQMFIYYCCLSLESCALAVLAYDRFIAICFPLRQQSLNTLQNMACIIGTTWIYCLVASTYSTAIMMRLSFCRSVRVLSFFCDYAPVFRLACNDYTLQWSVSSTFSMGNLFGTLTFIALSYASILVTVFRMKSLDSRIKALSTCVEHFILVLMFYVPILIIYILGLFVRTINPDHRVLSLTLSTCIPPCLNPLIYSLKTKEIKTRALALAKKVTAL